jgi:uncharacterized Fe-S cluster protein YjdI
MDAARQARVAFYLTGKRPGADLEPVEGLDVRPAFMARYRDLTALRYDYPLVLVDADKPEECVQALSGLIDEALREIARGDDGQRISHHVLRLERTIREAAGSGSAASLSALWQELAERLGIHEDDQLKDSLERARAALTVDGRVVNCDADLPVRVFSHMWRASQQSKARALELEMARLVHRVSNILRADFVRSERGRSAETLKASVGGMDAEAFDFDAMSRVLISTANRTTIAKTRRRRLEQLIDDLQSYDFEPEAFQFSSCSEALRAWQARLPVLVKVARAMAIAELEIAGDYREDRHDMFFEGYGSDGLPPDDIRMFADYLVTVNAETMDAGEQAALMEILSSGLPMKIVVQSDDILRDNQPGAGGGGFGRSAPHFANMALGLNEVYVLQASASHLLRCRDEIVHGMEYSGTALFSVFSGASDCAGDMPPYLVAAAAVESRAFPLFAYDPSAGQDWASRFSLAKNPQPESDWPAHEMEYEDAERKRVSETVRFTFADFAAMDERYARHLARVPSNQWDDAMVPVADAVIDQAGEQPERLPALLMVNGDSRVQKVLVDEKLLRETRRCRESWHSLQELGGIHNSYAERVREEERRLQAEQAAAAAGASEPANPEPAGLEAAATEAAVAEPEPESEPSPDEPYIETARCTTCNECTQINDKMFVYNENRQAYIADPDAGTYAELVEAAESCQVSIIHPGKPRNPDEPGLEELVARAEPFL